MMPPKKIKGLLDYLSLAPGEDFELEEPSENYIWGMGLGATEEATRWAFKGYQLELRERIDHATAATFGIMSVSAGRPKKSDKLKANQMRAFHLWLIVQSYPKQMRREASNKGLITAIRKDENLSGATRDLWNTASDESVEASVSKGKSWWGIDRDWNSSKCAEHWAKIWP